MPYFAGLAEVGRASLKFTILGAAYWIVHSLGIEVTNRLSDREEDEVNRPERTALCAAVGWSALKRIQRWLWFGIALIDVTWLLLAASPLFAALLLSSSLLGVAYSRGPRLSRNRYFGLVAVNLLFGGAFLLGWSVGDPLALPRMAGWHQLSAFMPLLVAVGIYILGLAGIKDITDRRGDLKIGYRSPFVDVIERRTSTAVWGLALVPFAALGGCALSGLLPGRLWLLTAFAPISALVTCAARRARGMHERLLVRELFYNYWLVFSSAALLLLLPRAALGLAVAGACAYWVVATRWLHWGEGLGIAGLGRVVRLAGLPLGSGASSWSPRSY